MPPRQTLLRLSLLRLSLLRLSLPRLSLLRLSLLIAGLWLPLAALANPQAVQQILAKAGTSGVARGPKTVGDDVKKEIETIARDAAQKTGGKFYVVLVDSSLDTEPYAALYQPLGLQGKDVLLVSNGPKWDLRVAALSRDQKTAILKDSADQKTVDRLKKIAEETTTVLAQVKTGKLSWNEFEKANAGKGWTSQRMSQEYQRYKSGEGQAITTVPSSQPAPSGLPDWTWGLLGALVLAVVGLVVWKRKTRDQTLQAELKQALSGPENILADAYLQMDGTEDDAAISRLNEVQADLDAVKQGPPTREAIAKARTLQSRASEARALMDQARRRA